MTRVLLADDHALVRDGIASLLSASGRFEVVGMAADGQEAVEQARQTQPDLVLMDVNMPICDGLAAARRLGAEMPQINVVMLTVSEEEEDLFEAVKAGARGYILKGTSGREFLDLLDGIARGEAAISRAMATKMLDEFARLSQRNHGNEDIGSLTEAERKVLQLVAEGAPNKEIAGRLCISENTVKYHLRHLLQKLHASNRAQAVANAMQLGLVEREQGRSTG